MAHADPTGEENALRPVTEAEKTWGWFAIFNIWANDVQSLFGYTLVASLFITYGVSGWTAFAALIAAGLMIMFLVNLSGAPGEKYGIPYPVLARASMGTAGAKLPAILRATVAVFWYGVQVYFASTALALLIRSLTGVSGGGEFLGLTGIDWLSFILVWAFHIVIFWRGMGWVETFLNIAGPFVYLVMIGLVIGGLWTSFISEFGIGGFVNTLGATLAPLYGIMIVDYYLHRNETLDRADLYDLQGGRYRYGEGWNRNAVIAFAGAAVFSVASVWIPALAWLKGYAWLIGAGLGALIFHQLSGRRGSA